MKIGDTRWIVEDTRVIEVVVALDLTMDFHNPHFEVKEPGKTSSYSTYFKHLSELYETRKEALQVARDAAEEKLKKAEVNLACAKGEVRWAKHTLKFLNKELDKEDKEAQNGPN